MAAILHPQTGWLVWSRDRTKPFGTSRNYPAYFGTGSGRFALAYANYEVSVTGLTPNKTYRLRHVDVRTNNNNAGGSFAGVETDIPTVSTGGVNENIYQEITTDSFGNWEGIFNPSGSSITAFGILAMTQTGLNFEDSVFPPENNEWMTTCFTRNTSSPPYRINSRTGNAWWDSILKYNPEAGYTRYLDESLGKVVNLVFIDRVSTYRVRVTETNQFDAIKESQINVSNRLAFEVGTLEASYQETPDFNFNPTNGYAYTIPVDLDVPVQNWTPIVDQTCVQPESIKVFGYSALIKRDFTTVDTRNLQLHTLEIFCENDPQNETYFLVNDFQDRDLTVDGTTRTFQATNFNFILSKQDEDSTPEMQVNISNVGGIVSQYIDRVRDFGRITVKYRAYLLGNASAQVGNPLELGVSEVNTTMFQVNARLTLTDKLDAKFPGENYNTRTFPNIFG